ncbi:MAG: type II secretion system F family protein [Micromonosporaceae bacterium]|nr:type II secretion system F family protein [Micromonosporaceae bacterium]
MLAAVLSLTGVVVGLVGVIGTTRPPRPPSALRRRVVAWWTGSGRTPMQRRARQALLLVALASAVATWLLTGWPVGGLLVGIAVPGIPWLFLSGVAERRAIDRLAAVESWTRRIADIVVNGLGLQAAIVATASTAPALIEDEVRGLAAGLQAGQPAADALRRFADEINDYGCDQVVAPLILHANDRGEGLATVLSDISRSLAAEVEMRRTINAKRAGPRFAVRFMTGMTVAVILVGVLNPQYLVPYQTVLGQIVLAVLSALYVALMVWVRRLSLPVPRARLLAPVPTYSEWTG